MYKEFVPYEESLELKELGFDEYCIKILNSQYKRNYKKQEWVSGYLYYPEEGLSLNKASYIYTDIPLYQQVFRWFREKYDLDSYVSRDYSLREIPKQYCYTIHMEEGLEESKNFNTYEEAELECLRKLIKIVKND